MSQEQSWKEEFQKKFPMFRLFEKYALQDLVNFIESVYEAGKEEGHGQGLIDGGKFIKEQMEHSRTATLKECIENLETIEKMPGVHLALHDYIQQLEKLLNP